MTPVVAMPAMAPAPMAMAPTPVTVVPTPVTAVPMHLLGLELRGFLAGGHRRVNFRMALRQPDLTERLRRQRRGLNGSSQCRGARRDTKGKFQKVPALHEDILYPIDRVMRQKCRGDDMN
ncbi:hypothetical protein GCM10010987_49570 [Bradyrhizobium guangdongense]|uniref:Uncharacterized protein n=1 Tax=Bradyrhizobium guangdongense TaxID=1325090 RepID=A0AA87W8G6_9BRAD|nr:hypothetical protein GCM10010987_49570 [Bradyrhizobium guangdongense]